MTPTPVPALPGGYEPLGELAARAGVRVVKARRGDDLVVLRLESERADGEDLAELAVLGAVDHPGLARLVDHGGLAGGGRFVARRWVEGSDLLAWSRGHGPEEIGRVVAELCPALEHLHRIGFVHGDVKAENVIVPPTGPPVLCDFGLTRPVRSEGETGGVSGTLFAIAPELLLGTSPTPRSDLFALGVLLHRMLVPARPGAAEFYGLFPARSFFDAIGSSPQDLPPWASDLVAALVARDPSRRPQSAAEVGRTLRARLGLEARADAPRELRFPVELGRETWLAAWFAEVEEGIERPGRGDRAPAPRWIRLPEGEAAEPIAEHLRLFLALRGIPSEGHDLDRGLRGLRTAQQLDAWARDVADRTAAGWVVAHADRPDPWVRRGIECLVRASRQGGGRISPRPVIVLAAQDPPASDLGWAVAALPPVEDRVLGGFLERNLDPDPRVAELARLLHEACGGSATRLDALLREAVRRGWLLVGERRLRLRPGPLPATLAPGEDAPEEPAAEPPSGAGREVLAALRTCGERARSDELRELLDLSDGAFGAALVELSSAGRVRLAPGPSGMEVERVPGAGVAPPPGEERARELHARRAGALERAGAEPWRHLPHRWRAEPEAAVLDALCDELADLRERGCAEIALVAIERVEGFAHELDLDPVGDLPRLVEERASSLCVLGETELAATVVEPLSAAKDPRVRALAELTRGRIARLRHDTDPALACFERAVALDPASRGKVEVERIHVLHAAGKDEEVCAAAAGIEADPDATGLTARELARVETIAAMSAFRLGRVDEARGKTTGLLERVRRLGDTGGEAALRINLATIERRTGSLERATAELERAEELFRESGRIAGIALAQATLGGVLRERGELAAAGPMLSSAIEIRERLGDAAGVTMVRGILGLLLAERGHARAAIEELQGSGEHMGGAQRLRFAPILFARADEMLARIGRHEGMREGAPGEEAPDPRVFLARARTRWIQGLPEGARSLAERAEALATSLGLHPAAVEARFLLAALRGDPDPEGPDGPILALLASTGSDFDAPAAWRLAEELEERGCDDRAARLLLAIAARCSEASERARARVRAQQTLGRCTAGLGGDEVAAFRQHLLAIPDPWPGDLIVGPEESTSEEELEMEVVSLLEINHRLVGQDDLSSLLGEIVESARKVTGAERGFLILEERGELRFDTALDSRRGDIEQPDLEVSRTVVDQALERMEPLRLSNAVDDPLLGHTPSVVSLELRSILCIPFRISDEVRGAIYVDHRLRSGAFSERSERLCALLADQAALAILQVQRLDEIRDLNRRLEDRIVRQESDLRTARKALEEVGMPGPAGGLVGSSLAMREVCALIERAAKSDLSILIGGASGTGKELAARALHELSARARAPFVSENCAALPPTLIESELFGYRRGAFTGADQDREGLFERAHGGTLFLDEIGDMPVELQAKLLRVLETGEIRRLGDSSPRKVDFRLVVATNRDLEKDVAEGAFRRDLFYRLDGLRVEMPTLAERTEDIPELVDHFLRLDEVKSGIRHRVAKPVLARLCRRPWPGNVRELKNEIARLCVMSEVDIDDPTLVREPRLILESSATSLPGTLQDLERKAIQDALAYTGGDKNRAAKLLGISRAKIYQRLKEWQGED